MRPLGGDAGSASPDGHRPRLPVELQPAAGRWALAEPKPPAHVWACGVLLPPTAAVLGFSLAVLLPQPARGSAQPALHWEQLRLKLKLSSGNIVLVAGYAETRIHMQQTSAAYYGGQ